MNKLEKISLTGSILTLHGICTSEFNGHFPSTHIQLHKSKVEQINSDWSYILACMHEESGKEIEELSNDAVTD